MDNLEKEFTIKLTPEEQEVWATELGYMLRYPVLSPVQVSAFNKLYKTITGEDGPFKPKENI